jgi:hypothetical protein
MRSPASRDVRPSGRNGRRVVHYALIASLGIHAALLAGLAFTRRSNSPAEAVAVELLIEGSEAQAFPPLPEVKPALGRAPSVGQETTHSTGRPQRGPAIRPKGEAPNPEATPTGEQSSAPDVVPSQEHSDAPGGLATFQPVHPDLRGALKLLPVENRRDVLAPALAKESRSAPGELPKLLRGGAGVTASIAEDGRIQLHDPGVVSVDGVGPQATGSGIGPGLSGRFDVTDQVMKWAGQDPYAAIKRKLADETREQRLCMARRYQGERQRQELFNLSGKIRQIAARVDLSAVERRRLVFEIWDECLEESDERSDYGVMARATIVTIVREVFPEGSDLAYRPGELVTLNGRRSSRQPFAPYQQVPARSVRHPDAGAPSEPNCGVL